MWREPTLPKERDEVITYWPCNTEAGKLGGEGGQLNEVHTVVTGEEQPKEAR